MLHTSCPEFDRHGADNSDTVYDGGQKISLTVIAIIAKTACSISNDVKISWIRVSPSWRHTHPCELRGRIYICQEVSRKLLWHWPCSKPLGSIFASSSTTTPSRSLKKIEKCLPHVQAPQPGTPLIPISTLTALSTAWRERPSLSRAPQEASAALRPLPSQQLEPEPG